MEQEILALLPAEEEPDSDCVQRPRKPIRRLRKLQCCNANRALLVALVVTVGAGAIAGTMALIIQSSESLETPYSSSQLGLPFAEPVVCSEEQFGCASGIQCVSKSSICDGVDQCADLSDERNCTTCPSYRFDCGRGSGQCIRREWRCDREIDCTNGADEQGCDVCNNETNQYTCRNYNCVARTSVCNGVNDCGDLSDEATCLTISDTGILLATSRGQRPRHPVCYEPLADWKTTAADFCTLAGKSQLRAAAAGVTITAANEEYYYLLHENLTLGGSSILATWTSTHTVPKCQSGQVVALTCQECGTPTTAGRRKRVVGGHSISTATKWPWYAKLIVDGTELCGGTLISDRHVLTAAHCFDKLAGKTLKVTLVLGTDDMSGLGGTEATSESVHIHPKYQQSDAVKRYDLALVEIPPVTYSAMVMPACLPRQWEHDVFTKPAICYVVGFGRVLRGSSRAAYPRRLQEAKVKIFSREECQFFYKDNHVEMEKDVLCAGSDTGGVDTCAGDSGGPLVCLQGSSWWLVGVTSWGFRCGSAIPSIYGSVADASHWILSLLNM